MAKKSKKKVSDLIGDIGSDLSVAGQKKYIPDILEFCYSKDYLGLDKGSNPVKLYPFQSLILKCFYIGSEGNENLKFTDDDVKLCEQLGLDDRDKGDLIHKMKNDRDKVHFFRELVLVLGRRSGKDYITSIIALYEVMKLLEYKTGNPYEKYGISSSNPITILTVANNSTQSKIAFNEIREKLVNSEYFSNRIGPDGLESSAIWIMTDQDIKDAKLRKEKGLPPSKKGSIVIEVGNSNATGLLGKGVFVLILDEVATYKEEGASSGDVILQGLKPALMTYGCFVDKKDEEGNVILDDSGEIEKEKIYESKIILISSPREKEGILWKYFSEGHDVRNRLVARLSTWEANPTHTEVALRENNTDFSDEQFNMEYGAQFSGIGSYQMFPADLIECMFTSEFNFRPRGEPGKIYFMHLDPASTSHNYALVVVHKDMQLNYETQKSENIIFVDHIKVWKPQSGQPVLPSVVEKYIQSLKESFRMALVTYDQWNSIESINRLSKMGIPHALLRYNQTQKMKIYSELQNLMIGKKIKCPHHKLLKEELLSLQKKPVARGFKIFPKKTDVGQFTDDIVDALAGACYSCITASIQSLPNSRLVNTGYAPSGNQRMWQGMQGPMGYGTGFQVTKMIDRQLRN